MIESAADVDARRLDFRAELQAILRDIDFVERAAVDQFLNAAEEPKLRDDK